MSAGQIWGRASRLAVSPPMQPIGRGGGRKSIRDGSPRGRSRRLATASEQRHAAYMRIVGGKFRSRAIAAPPGNATRPTADRVRESVFNVLEHADWSPGLEGRRVLDLFAGA